MQHQKIKNLLDNATNQPSKIRTKNWAEINDKSRGTYNTNNQIKFRNSMLKSSLCDYTDNYIAFKGTITFPNTGRAAAPDKRSKKLVWKIIYHSLIAKVKYTIRK